MPWPIGLVVKNGSNTWAITSGDMPVPVSVTQSDEVLARRQVVLARAAARRATCWPSRS